MKSGLTSRLPSGGHIIGRSGGMGPDGEVDPWSRFFNVYMLDRDGNRIDRRNPENIFIPLYNYQVPPGAGDVTHFALHVPEDALTTIIVDVKLQYRKFDTTYMKHVKGANYNNTLPVLTLASDRVVFPVTGETAPKQESVIDPWQHGMTTASGSSERPNRQAAAEKANSGKPNSLSRKSSNWVRPTAPQPRTVYLREGRLEDAVAALTVAANHASPAYPWSIAYFSTLVDKQNGNLDSAIENLRKAIDSKFPEAVKREFNFRGDYRLLNELGRALLERSKMERGDKRKPDRDQYLQGSFTVVRRGPDARQRVFPLTTTCH